MSFRLVLLTSALGGFIALSYELVWFRAYSFFTRGAPGTFGLLLGAYLLGIALGALGARPCCRDVGRDGARPLRALAWFVLVANLIGFLVVPLMAWAALRDNTDWPLPMIAVAAGALGATLPLLAHFGVRPDDRAGAGLSYVYGANIVGSCLGSLATGYILLDVWSLKTTAVFLAWAGCALTTVLIVFGGLGRSRRLLAVAGLALVGVGATASAPLLYHKFYEKLLLRSHFEPTNRFAHVLENRHGVITVMRDGQVYGGGAYDGVINLSLIRDRNYLERAFSVTALHPAPREVLMIGLSSGSWAQVISHLEGVEHLTVIEINSGYLELIALYPEVKGVLDSPKVTIEIDDGRRWLRRHPERKFDMVVQNTTWHWRAHISNLLSTEYLDLVRAHLRPGGIFYYNTTKSLDVLRTAVDKFPYVLGVGNFVAVSDTPFGFDAGRWRSALERTVINGAPSFDLSRPEDRTRFDEFLKYAELPPGSEKGVYLETKASLVRRTRGATAVTDDNMICEWRRALRD